MQRSKSFLLSLAVMACAAMSSAFASAAPPDAHPQSIQIQAATPAAVDAGVPRMSLASAAIASDSRAVVVMPSLFTEAPRSRPLGLQYAVGDFGHVGKLCCQRVDQASPRPYRIRT